ncbi:MAG: HAMP domain-containing histidine kinase [Bacteroidales bacterium]|nr:HAMP domain-containing histidine kinase [Bacteroidales bacterium]
MNAVRHILTIFSALLMTMFSCVELSAKNDPRVLIVSSYNPDAVSASKTINAFVDHFNERCPDATILIENMNCKSLSEAHSWTSRTRDILNKYSETNHKPDIIVLLGQEAWASFLSLNPSEINSQIPVMCAMASRNIVRMPSDTCRLDTWMPSSIDYTFLRSRYNIVGGTLYEYDIDKNIELIRRLYPETKNIALLTDNSYGGLTLLAHVNDCMRRYSEYNLILLDGRVETIYSMSERISNLPENTVMLVGTWRVDMTESYYVKNSTRLLKDANHDVPAFALSAVGLDYWAVGGFLPDYRSQGIEIAEKVLDYLDDLQHDKIRTSSDAMTVVGGHYVFDRDVVNESNIDESVIPDDVEWVNYRPSFYQQYRYYFWAMSFAFVGLLFIILVLTYFFRRTRKLTASLKESQAELIAARDKAEEGNKQKTAFLANMSHEIRTPLNAIVGFAEVLTTDESLSAADRMQINDIIGKNSQMLLGLINDILDMSRLESGRTKFESAPCDVMSLCADVLETCKTASRRDDVDFILDAVPNHLRAVVDAQHLRQVLINLLSNANKFTKSGSICLTVRRKIHVIEFSVTDTGIGVPKDKQKLIFNRFEKVNETSQGFGIGLSLCKSIVEHFGGEIYLDPRYTKGAKFVFTLPFIEPSDDGWTDNCGLL